MPEISVLLACTERRDEVSKLLLIHPSTDKAVEDAPCQLLEEVSICSIIQILQAGLNFLNVLLSAPLNEDTSKGIIIIADSLKAFAAICFGQIVERFDESVDISVSMSERSTDLAFFKALDILIRVLLKSFKEMLVLATIVASFGELIILLYTNHLERRLIGVSLLLRGDLVIDLLFVDVRGIDLTIPPVIAEGLDKLIQIEHNLYLHLCS